MTTPVRLQLSRRKGFDLQALSLATNGLLAVNVARPGRWGNPFTVAAVVEGGYTRDRAVAAPFVVSCFREWWHKPETWWQGGKSERLNAWMRQHLTDLRGHNLACWCAPGQPCHADVLLELANAPHPKEGRP